MSATTDLLREIEPMMTAIASEYGRRHRVHGADGEDFFNEQVLWVLEHEAKVREWLDPEFYEPEHGGRILAKALRNCCKDVAVDIKAQAVGYKRDDLHWYSKGELKVLLPAVFDPEKWQEPPQSDGRSARSYAEGNNWVAILSDVSRAFDSLEKYDRDLLTRFHKYDRSNRDNAEYFEVSEQTMSYHHDRALGRLLKALGGARPGSRQRDPWVGRTAMSNAQARAVTKGTYDDD